MAELLLNVSRNAEPHNSSAITATINQPEPGQHALGAVAEAEALEATDEAALRSMDRRRSKKGSNAEWIYPHEREARITRMEG